MIHQNESGNRGRRDTPVLHREPQFEPDAVFHPDEFPAESWIEFENGDLVAGRYEILSLLGRGGMGFVYLVQDKRTERRYAMKTVSAMNATERVIQRFQIEAKATSLIKHPNVVQFHDFGLIDGVQPYFVMDYCEGDTLADLIEAQGSLPFERVLEIFIPICSALAYAHTQAVVHRDLKPSNILIKRLADGTMQVKILDFGIAKVLIDETAFNRVTKTGELFGSPYYMSPEQCVGKGIDTRSDIYSLGCVMYEALTGNPPFMAENPLTTMMKHQTEAPHSLKEATLGREFPEDLERIVAAMLAKLPDERYQNLLLVEHDLRLLQRGEALCDEAQDSVAERKVLMPGAIAAGIAALLVACTVTYFVVQPGAQRHAGFGSGKAYGAASVRGSSARSGSDGSNDNSTNSHPTQGFKTLDLPDLNDISKAARSVPKRYFSDDADIHSRIRRFHFPATSVGMIGHGMDNIETFVPAAGAVTIDVPVTFVVGKDAGQIAGFRPDEVSELTMSGPLVDEYSTNAFRNWTELKSLDLNWTDIGDRAIENIRSLPKLAVLHVSETHISATGLSQLNLSQLKYLDANEILYVAPVLAHANSLQVLKLANSGLKNDDLKLLAKLPALSILDITGNGITDQGLAHLIGARKLGQLWFAANPVTPKCVDTLLKMHLKGVTLNMTHWTDAQKSAFTSQLRHAGCSVFDQKGSLPARNNL